ncbi:MAG: sulfatase-like hydrolase/transferase, partial [Acidobacteria bacterium]|nr:sulfatase-like hydrolase/transferase [Acidobacteriota bacterium]
MNPHSRQLAARVVDAGLFVTAGVILVVLGGGGAPVALGPPGLELGRAFLPLAFFGALAGLRILLGSRTGGLEARVLRAFARLGLPPRDLPATPFRAARGGAVLGAGFGAAMGLADGVRVALSSGPSALSSPAALSAFTLSGLMAVALSGLFGAVTGALVAALFPAVAGRRTGRYEAGRWTAAALLVAGPFVLLLGPPLGSGEATPLVLIGTAAAFVLGLALFCFLLPAAWLQVVQGRFTLALALAGTVVSLAVTAWALDGVGARDEAGETSAHSNVLLVTITGLRADAVGAYGATATATPALDALAEQGASFGDTVTPSRVPAAAGGSLLTGLYPSSHGLRDEGDALPPGTEGLPERLSAHGYRCGAFVSARELEGRSTGLAQLFETYEDAASTSDWLPLFTFGSLVRRANPMVTRPVRGSREALEQFRAWLGTLPPGAPWCAWIELGEPAWPLPAPATGGSDAVAVPSDRRDLAQPLRDPPAWSRGTERTRSLAAWMEGYREAVAAADGAVGALQQLLLERGELHRTLLVVTAEGGIPLGEQGAWIDGRETLDEGVVRVPWLIAGPGVIASVRVAGPTSLVDLAPTVLGLLRLGGARDAEGEDLSRFLGLEAREERDPGSGPVFSEAARGPGGERSRSVRIGSWKLVREASGDERLFLV